MPDVCTCGAQLPPDARFCHKCGKPQRDEPLIPKDDVHEEAVSAPPPPPLPAPPPPQISFQNRLAVRSALLAGLFALLATALLGQVAQPLAFVAVIGAGFFAVYRYEKWTGQRLSVMAGARLGWLCGIFLFVAMMVILAVMAVILSDPEMLATLRQQMQSSSTSIAQFDEMIKALRTPSGIVAALFSSFAMFTILPACGGALGAKLLGRAS